MTTRLYATFHLGNTFFGVDSADVQEVLRAQPMTRVPLASREIEGLINLRGQIVVAIDLRKRLEYDPLPEGTEQLNVIVRTEHGPVSFIVDRIDDVVEADDDDLEFPPATLRGPTRELVTAIHPHGDQLLLIIDVKRVMQTETAAA